MNFWDNLLSVFLKSTCPLCQRNTYQILCEYCDQKVKVSQTPMLKQKNTNIFYWGYYEGDLKRIIANFKYNNQPKLGQVLGEWMAERWMKEKIVHPSVKLTVIPIPLHLEKLKKRGFNQAELLAKAFAEVMGYPLERNALIRVKDTQALFGANLQERKAILEDSLAVGSNFRGKISQNSILIVDDIYTTGTTANHAITVLEKAGFSVFGVLTLAGRK